MQLGFIIFSSLGGANVEIQVQRKALEIGGLHSAMCRPMILLVLYQ